MCARCRSPWGKPRAALVLSALLTAGIVGCGGSSPFDAVPVSGTITYEDGSVISGSELSLTFSSHAEGIDNKFPRDGLAEVDMTDGTFSEVTTDEPGDGLIVGKHTVSAVLRDASGKGIELTIVEPEITVTDGGSPLVIKVKKP